MKQSLVSIVKAESNHLIPEALRKVNVILVKLNANGSVDQDHLSHAFVDVHGKQGPGLNYVVTLEELKDEIEGDYAGNPARKYFVRNKKQKIFEVKAYGQSRANLVIFADHVEEAV